MPLVSVVVPCLNRADYLKPTIASILQQDYPNIECIVIDGGSKDGTIAILKSYGDKIKWVSEPDKCHADAINKGWKMSSGEILAWLNADDVWAVPNAVSEVVKRFKEHPDWDLIYGDCGAIDEAGNLVGMSYAHEWDLEYAVTNCDHCIPQPAAFIRRKIVEKVGWLDTVFYIKDREFWLRIALVGNIQYIPVFLASARNIKGMSYDGKKSAPACVQLTRKFFSLPNAPASLRNKERLALSNSYIVGMDYAYVGGRLWKIIINHALCAIREYPKNFIKVARRLKEYVQTDISEGKASQLASMGMEIAYLFVRAYRKIGRLLSGSDRPRIPNLLGDRDIEWTWIASQMPSGDGRALDFGSGNSYLGLIAAQKGFNVTAVDLENIRWDYVHPHLHFIQGNIMKLPLPMEHFDLVINCSAIEHVGLSGRYDVTEDIPDGDLAAMERLRNLMKSGGIMLLTVPVGLDATFAPLSRIYGKERLPRLLDGLKVIKEAYWVKNSENRWIQCDRETALKFKASAGSWNPLQNVVALGCFILRRP